MKIVGTLLSGNNASLVMDAVRSVIEWVDLLLLVDTGITDNTAEVVQAAAGSKFRCTQFAWCNDFSAARNAALQHAQEYGATWALTIDTDERLIVDGVPSPDDLRAFVAAEPDILVWLVAERGGTYAKERLIRVSSAMRWTGRTHESFAGASAAQCKVLPGVFFSEIPKTSEAFQEKVERDLLILQEETRDHPNDARWWYYLGQTLEGLRRHREAIDAYRRCAGLEGWPEEGAWACYQAARCFGEMKDFRAAVQMCAVGLARLPASPELAWLAGFCSYQLGEYHNAISWEKMAIALGNFEGIEAGKGRIHFRYLPGWYEGPYDVLGFAYHQMGLHDLASEAASKFQQAFEMRLKDEKSNRMFCDIPDLGSSLLSSSIDGENSRYRVSLRRDMSIGYGRKVLFDLGAHCGESVNQLARELGLDKTWEIHMFEPNPACRLSDRMSAVDLPIQIHNSAVWVRDGTIGFRQQDPRYEPWNPPIDNNSFRDGVGSCLDELKSSHPGLQTAIEVCCEDFARILESYTPQDYVVTKMDVEGAEFAILREVIRRGVANRIKRLYVEWHERLLSTETQESRIMLAQELIGLGIEVMPWA